MIQLVALHGMGSHRPGYAAQLIERTVKALRADADLHDVSIEATEVLYSDILDTGQMRQIELYARRLAYTALRQFFLATLADSIAYQPTLSDNDSYARIHYRVAQALQPAHMTVLVAHSLGSVVASNYLWDHPELCRRTVFVTLGSPLALWAQRYADFGVPVTPLRWANLYSRYDPLAFPLQVLTPAYQAAVTHELQVHVGGLIGFTPWAHIHYWRSARIAEIVAGEAAIAWRLRDTPA